MWWTYSNSDQAWDAWIQSRTWKARSLGSQTEHIKEQTGEWHQALLWSLTSQKWKQEPDSTPYLSDYSDSLSLIYLFFISLSKLLLFLSFISLTHDGDFFFFICKATAGGEVKVIEGQYHFDKLKLFRFNGTLEI